MRKGSIVTTCGLLAGLLFTSSAQAALVARWSFDAGNASALNADVGGYALTPRAVGSGQTTVFNADGTVSLGGGQQLYTTGVNAAAIPTLTSNATLYARVRFDATPGAGGTFAALVTGAAGAVPATYPASSGATTALAGFTPSATTAANYAKLTSGNSIAPGGGFPTIPANGTAFTTIAIVFNDLADAGGATSATRSQSSIYVDGVLVSRDNVGTSLAAFDYLAIGRVVSNASAGATTFDEVRLYDEALSAAQIAAIVPEPASLAAIACVVLPGRRRRSV